MKDSFDEESIAGLVTYRIQRAKETMFEAKLLLDQDCFNASINRLYYACYYAVIALLAKNGISAQTHGGAKQMLGLHFVVTGKLSPKVSSFYSTVFEKRHSSDYDDFAFSDRETVEKLYPQALEFIATIEELIHSK